MVACQLVWATSYAPHSTTMSLVPTHKEKIQSLSHFIIIQLTDDDTHVCLDILYACWCFINACTMLFTANTTAHGWWFDLPSLNFGFGVDLTLTDWSNPSYPTVKRKDAKAKSTTAIWGQYADLYMFMCVFIPQLEGYNIMCCCAY